MDKTSTSRYAACNSDCSLAIASSFFLSSRKALIPRANPVTPRKSLTALKMLSPKAAGAANSRSVAYTSAPAAILDIASEVCGCGSAASTTSLKPEISPTYPEISVVSCWKAPVTEFQLRSVIVPIDAFASLATAAAPAGTAAATASAATALSPVSAAPLSMGSTFSDVLLASRGVHSASWDLREKRLRFGYVVLYPSCLSKVRKVPGSYFIISSNASSLSAASAIAI